MIGRDPPMIFGIIKINPFLSSVMMRHKKLFSSLPGKQRNRNRQTIQNGIF